MSEEKSNEGLSRSGLDAAFAECEAASDAAYAHFMGLVSAHPVLAPLYEKLTQSHVYDPRSVLLRLEAFEEELSRQPVVWAARKRAHVLFEVALQMAKLTDPPPERMPAFYSGSVTEEPMGTLKERLAALETAVARVGAAPLRPEGKDDNLTAMGKSFSEALSQPSAVRQLFKVEPVEAPAEKEREKGTRDTPCPDGCGKLTGSVKIAGEWKPVLCSDCWDIRQMQEAAASRDRRGRVARGGALCRNFTFR